ncbi:MAG: hypothetical protein ISQ06_08360 [Planctomycetaceae bacterium]|nr:hypothetical protein [Planctomycetaceae bacterium]
MSEMPRAINVSVSWCTSPGHRAAQEEMHLEHRQQATNGGSTTPPNSPRVTNTVCLAQTSRRHAMQPLHAI